MAISVVRLGSPRAEREGPRLGTVRRPPRGVKKRDYARLGHYDAWLPELSPSAKLVKLAQSGDWSKFARLYRREMRAQARLIGVLAASEAANDHGVDHQDRPSRQQAEHDHHQQRLAH